MSKTCMIALATAVLLAIPNRCESAVLFYGGDQTNQVAPTDLFFVSGPGESGTIVFDDFTVTNPIWTVDRFRLRFMASSGFSPSFGQWELRKEVAEGTGGELLFSDDVAPVSISPTGRVIANFPEYELTFEVSGLSIAKGRYWLGLRPFGDALIAPSNGENAVGGPILNDDSYARSTFSLYNYRSLSDITGRSHFDLSFKVEGTAVPEPTSGILLGLATFLAGSRRQLAKK